VKLLLDLDAGLFEFFSFSIVSFFSFFGVSGDVF